MHEDTPPKHSLPPISTLFKDSWELFKKSALKLLVLTLISYLAMGVIVIAAVGILLVLGFTQVLTNTETGVTQILSNPILLIGLVFVVITALLLLIIANVVLQIAMILAINQQEEKTNYQELIKKSLSLSGSFLLVGLLTALLVIGGLVLFIIPGIVIGVYLAFANYELLFHNHKGTEALKRSFALVSTNFFPIVGRLAIFVVISLIITSIGPKEGQAVILMTIINALVGWFGICYSIALYKQVAESNKNLPGRNLKPLVLTAVAGGVIAIGLLTVAASIAPKVSEMMSTQERSKIIDQSTEVPNELNMPTDEELNQMMEELDQETNNQPTEETI